MDPYIAITRLLVEPPANQRKAYIRATRYSSSEPAIGPKEVRLKMSKWIVRAANVSVDGTFMMPDGAIPLNVKVSERKKNPILIYYAEPAEE